MAHVVGSCSHIVDLQWLHINSAGRLCLFHRDKRGLKDGAFSTCGRQNLLNMHFLVTHAKWRYLFHWDKRGLSDGAIFTSGRQGLLSTHFPIINAKWRYLFHWDKRGLKDGAFFTSGRQGLLSV